MAKNSIRDYANAAASNTDVQSQNIDEGCSPAGINNAIREIMADLADVNDGTVALVSPNFDSATLGVAPNAGRSVDAFPSGTKMLFQQSTAPIGWVKETTHNDKALRITNGTVSTGGSVAFETAFASHTPSGSVSVTIAGHALEINEIPNHSHLTFNNTRSTNTVFPSDLTASNAPFQQAPTGGSDYAYAMKDSGSAANVGKSSDAGGDQEHTHGVDAATFTGTAINLDVSYVDVIIATKS